jgi:hypothetical protein
MSKPLYNLTSSEEFKGATIFLEGEPHSVSQDHPNWDAIRAILFADDDPEDQLLDLVLPGVGVSNKLSKLSERVAYKNDTIFFDGDPIDNALTEHIVRLIQANADEKGYIAFVRLLEKLSTNPSKKSRKHLFHFIQSHKITLHPDGDLILYKGVRNDGTSSHAGYGIVDGVEFGEVDLSGARPKITGFANLPNAVGSVVEIPRSLVDDDRNIGCSTGLHAGTYGYASTFAPKLLTVKVNPRDVVSVPSEFENAKVRVSRYLVLEENNGEYTEPTADLPVEEDVPDVPEVQEPKTPASPAPVVDAEPPATDEPFLGTPGVNFRDPNAEGVAPDPTAVVAQAPTQAQSDFDKRVGAMEGMIPTLISDGVNLRRFRNKRLTEKNRKPFDQALSNLGFNLS